MAGLTPPSPMAETDARETFQCGRRSLDLWLHRHAWRDQVLGRSRTSVVSDLENGMIAGYVSLAPTQIEPAELTLSMQDDPPDPVPAIFLAQLAVDIRYQRLGVAKSLLFFTLSTARRVAGESGCFCVLTRPLDEGNRAFYRHFGFEDLPFDPGRSMALRVADLPRHGF